MKSEGVQPKTDEDIDAFVSRCMGSFPYFARSCLKIKTKTEGIKPLIFNRAQQYLQEVADWMTEKYGKVRIIIVKARQQGLSTWVEGRGYWKAIHNEGTKVYILTHEGDATKNLFAMAKRYHDYCPPDIKPFTKRSNTREMIFSDLESEYAVGTAKTGDTGRSQTMQFFHGSEAAYWPDAQAIADGLLQGLPDEPGTEAYLESTVKGVGDYFHNTWMSAVYPDETPGEAWNGYVRVFIPWFWEEKYRETPPLDFVVTKEEIELVKNYKLQPDQVYWRRKKIIALEGDMSRFNREYPASPEDAFNASAFNVLIKSESVVKARHNGKIGMYMPTGSRVLGIDVAREGDDDTAFAVRQGRVCEKVARFPDLKTNEVASKAVIWMRDERIDYISIDMTGGYGAGVYDLLVMWGLGAKLVGVNFASKAIDEVKYKNKRTEMWVTMRDWLNFGAQVPDSAALQTDLCSIQYEHNTVKDQLELEPKKKAKSRLGKSPDIAEALGLTFYRPSFMMEQGAGVGDSVDPFDFFAGR